LMMMNNLFLGELFILPPWFSKKPCWVGIILDGYIDTVVFFFLVFDA
jgi:hypothetical protein